jgi:uncharacterized integral membrane protein (TIGR00697 family)
VCAAEASREVNLERRRLYVLLILSGTYIMLNVMTSLVSTKVAVVGGVTFATGVLLSQLSYGLLDVVNDWRGKSDARALVMSAIIVRALFYFVIVPVVLLLPASVVPAGYDALLGGSLQLVVASMIAMFLASWLVNVSLFSWLREKTKGRWFIARYCVTTLPAFTVSASVIAVVGYWGVPGVNILAVAFGTTLVRIVVAVGLIPVVAGVRWAVRRCVDQSVTV